MDWFLQVRDRFIRNLYWVLTVLGLLLLLLQFGVDEGYLTLNFGQFANELIVWLVSLGNPILIGGVFGSLLKSYQYLGIFRDAVKEVIFEKPWFDDRHLIDLWKKISNAIWKDKFPELASFLHNTILDKYSPTNKDFYYSEFEVSYCFSWKSDSNKKVLLREETSIENL
jgi:hypothetical protein